jgi:hypothetical protein
LKASPAITWADPADTVYGAALGAAQLNATADIPGTFIYSPSAGTVPPAGIETLTATFTPDDAANFAATTASVSLRVLKAKGTITWAAPADMVYGSALGATQLNAATDIAGAFVYTPAAGAVLAAGSHTLSVTFTPSDGANYEPATARVALTVVKATPLITWATPADVVYGTALSVTQLNATSAVEGTFTYTPALDAVLPAGPQTLSVTFTPNDGANYNTATATVPLTVLKAAPAITWAVPTDIAYGTALSAAQLNATSALEGTFAYTPAIGAVLPAGPQTLSVTFTPTDAANYTAATATVSLIVVEATSTTAWLAPADIVYGRALSTAQLNATSAVEGTFTYTPAIGTVLSAGPQPLPVTFTPTDATNYNAATATVSLTLLKALPWITQVMVELVYPSNGPGNSCRDPV